MEAGDDIWVDKASFDWQKAMDEAQGDQDDMGSAFKISIDGKISMQ